MDAKIDCNGVLLLRCLCRDGRNPRDDAGPAAEEMALGPGGVKLGMKQELT
jgi:hypothetical protein